MEVEIIMNTIFANWVCICIWFSVIAFGFGVVHLSISFLIWTTITLEGKIKTEKVWRQAIKEYAEKRYKLKEKDLNFESEDK